MLAVTALLRWLFHAPFLPELMAQRLFELVPMNVFEFFILALGPWSKWVAFAGTILLTLIFAGLMGRVMAEATKDGRLALHGAAMSIALTVFGAGLVMPLLGFEPTGSDLFPVPRFPALIGIFIGSAAYCAWFVWGVEKVRAIKPLVGSR